MKKILLISLLALTISDCGPAPGAGGSVQIAPDKIQANEGGLLKLELSVWGEGGSIAGRYTNVVAYYRLAGQDSYTARPGKLVPQTSDREVYEFPIPPYPKGTSGEIEYYFELSLDGQRSQVKGLKRIKLVDGP